MPCTCFINLFVYLALRTLRTLRSISFIRGLQVLVNALVQTFKSSVFYLLLLLLVLMFLFGIMGYYFFGYEDDGDKKNWGSFGQSLLSLFTFVTVSMNIYILVHVHVHVHVQSNLGHPYKENLYIKDTVAGPNTAFTMDYMYITIVSHRSYPSSQI